MLIAAAFFIPADRSPPLTLMKRYLLYTLTTIAVCLEPHGDVFHPRHLPGLPATELASTPCKHITISIKTQYTQYPLQGDMFPIHGTCLGFQLLHILVSNVSRNYLLVDTDSVAHRSTLEFTPAAAKSRFMGALPVRVHSGVVSFYCCALPAFIWILWVPLGASAFIKTTSCWSVALYRFVQAFFTIVANSVDKLDLNTVICACNPAGGPCDQVCGPQGAHRAAEPHVRQSMILRGSFFFRCFMLLRSF